MTNDEWFNVKPENSFYNEKYRVKDEHIDYNIVFEYPKRVVSKDELKEFLKKNVF